MAPKKQSSIKIKRPGAFTAKVKAAGLSVQQMAKNVLAPDSKASALTKKQANFAKVSRTWKHSGGRNR